MRDNWSLLVKPTNDCNHDCQYCHDEPNRRRYHGMKMDFNMIDRIARLASEHAKKIQWIWHGGEPTLMGVEWYKQAQEVFYKYYNTEWTQHMQSNGSNLNKEWAELAKNYNIQIGVSYDAFAQDIRIGSNKKRLEEIIKEYEATGASIGTITVINKANYKRQIELYEYFKNNFNFGFAFNQLFRSQGTISNDLEVSAEDYANEFLKYFKYWVYDVTENAREERSAMEALNQVIGNRHNLCCTYSDCRYNWVGINANGDIYPCDRALPERYLIGNVMNIDSVGEIYSSEGHRLYATEISKRHQTTCTACGYFDYCRGLCNASHIAYEGTLLDTFSCDVFKYKFIGTYRILRDMDIYKEKYSMPIIVALLEQPFITVNEIKNYLKKKGYNKELKYEESMDKLLECSEFKMFRVFNQFKGERSRMTEKEGIIVVSEHTDYKNFELRRDISLSAGYDMNNVKENRTVLLDTIFAECKDEIEGVLFNG